jgi:hypothetical protein
MRQNVPVSSRLGRKGRGSPCAEVGGEENLRAYAYHRTCAECFRGLADAVMGLRPAP